MGDRKNNLYEADRKKLRQNFSRWDENRKYYSEYGSGQGIRILFYDYGIHPDQVLASALGNYAVNHPCRVRENKGMHASANPI
ncbi:MAG: hypothetical protein DLM72_12300 [Candidatus Nitrosopolaris wilkensis]|nr:MAG: hypothetical protein DLM72_12300 [Candidatus Nitrosopolaris wilkensis]